MTSMLFSSCCIILGIHIGPKYWMLPAHLSQLLSGFGNCSYLQHESHPLYTKMVYENQQPIRSMYGMLSYMLVDFYGINVGIYIYMWHINTWYENSTKHVHFNCQPNPSDPNKSQSPPNPRVPLPAHQGTPLLSPNPLACLPRPSRKNWKWRDNLWFLSRFPSDSLCSYDMVNTFSFTNVSLFFLHIWSQIMHTWVNPPDWTLYLCIFHPIRTKKNGKKDIYKPLNTSTLKISPSLVHHLEHVRSLSTQPLPNKQVPLLTLDHISHFHRENPSAGTITYHFITQGS